VSPSGGLFDLFGSAVAVDGDSLIVGAPGEDLGGETNAGASYVFVRAGGSWSLQQRLASSAPAFNGAMGFAVAIAGNTALVGVPENGAGRVLHFERAGDLWTEQGTLTASDGTPQDRFGHALAFSDPTAVIGAPQAWVPGAPYSGAAYVFVRSGAAWTEQQKLVGHEPGFGAEVGTSVAVSGDSALLGSNAVLNQPGFALLFERSGGLWSQKQWMAAFDAGTGDRFGATVALSSEFAAVGAPLASTPSGIKSGAVYVLVAATTDLAIGITGTPANVPQGDLVTFEIVVSNNGPHAAPDVGVVSSLDAGLVFDSVSTSQGACTSSPSGTNCLLGVVPAGSSATVSVVAAAMVLGTHVSQASIQWGGADPVPANDIASTSTTVVAGGPADLWVMKTSLKPTAEVGLFLPYRVDVTNLGPATAVGVVVEDATPPNLTLLGVFGDCEGSFPCVLPRIPAGQTPGRSLPTTTYRPPIPDRIRSSTPRA